MRKTILLFCCVCCFLIQPKAQTCQPTWINYTTANSGLISNTAVEGVAIDASGNKWITTGGSGGVSVFDGTNWTTYNSANSGLPNDNCYGIGVDHLNNKWIGASSSIVKFDGSTWTVYNSTNSGFPSTSEVRSVTVDASNNLWVGTQSGLALFNGSVWSVYNPTNSGISSYGVMDVAIDASGKKWIATQGGGVSVFDGSTWTIYNTGNSGLPHNEVWAVGIDASGNKWFGTLGGGVCKFDGSTWTTYNTSNSGLIHNNVRALAFDGSGRVYFGGAYSNTGVSVFDGTGWTVYTPSNSALASSYIFDMVTDAQGDVWVGGAVENGVSVIHPCPLAPLCVADTVTVTETICNGDLPYTWNGHIINNAGIGVDTLFLQNGGGCDSLVVLDLTIGGNVWATYTGATSGLVNDNVRSVAVDAAGNKWFGTFGGVSRFDGTTWTSFTTSNSGISSNFISDAAIATENSGNVWFGTQGGGATVFDGTAWTSYTTSNSGIATNVITGIAIDLSGNKWFAAYGGGVSKFDGTNWTNYNSASGLGATTSECIAVDLLNRVWAGFGTGGGVSVFNGTSWATYNTGNSGLTNNGVNGIAVSPSGNMWFATGNGVSMFDGTTWVTYNSGNSGLVNNYVSDVASTSTGEVWFATAGGISMFDGSVWHTYTTANSGLLANISTDVAIGNSASDIWISHSGFGGASSFTNPCAPTCTPSTGVDVQTACGSFTWIDGNTYTTGNNTATHILVGGNIGGCDSTVTLNLTINPLPNLSVAGTITGCDAVDLTSAIITDANNTGATFAWFSDAACTVPVTNPGNVTVSAMYYAVGTAASCSDTVNVNATVHASPNLSVTGTVGNCGSIDLSAIAITDANNTGAAFSWFTDAACTTPVANPGNVTVSTTYYAVGISAACSDTVSVNVTPNVSPDLSAPSTFSGCDVMNLDTVSIVDANNTGATFAWYTDAACTLSVINQNVTVSGVYYAVGTSISCSDTVGVNVSIHQTFTTLVSVETNVSAACSNSTVSFAAVVTDGGSNPSFQWYKNGVPVGTNSNIYATNALTGTDEIYVIVSISEPCATSASIESNHVMVPVTPSVVPQVTITVAPSNIFNPGQQVTFTALATAGGPNPVFTWLKNGAPISGAPTGSTYSTNNLQNGDVISCQLQSNALCATPDHALSNAITMSHTSGAGITSNDIQTNLTVYPNPANDVVYISLEAEKDYPNVVLRLMDISGKLVLTQQRAFTAGKQQFSLEIFSLPQGVYQLQMLMDSDNIISKKVLIIK